MTYKEKITGASLSLKKFLDKFPKLHNIYLIVSISCIAGFTFGVDISSMSAFIGTSQYNEFFDTPGATIQGVITACMALGSFFGAILSAFVSEPLGRRASLLFSAFFWIIGSIIQASVQNRTQLCLGRVISGFGVGFGSSVAPIYGSELAARKIRGLIGGLFQFSVTLGILVMFYVGYGLGKIPGYSSFRLAWGLQIVPGFLLLLGCLFIPESPRWLAKHGHWEDCELIVAQIQAKGNREDPDVMIEISEIKEQILLDEKSKSFSYLDLLSKKYFLRTVTSAFAQIWQQLTGMNVMMYYIRYIFEMAGYEGDANLVASSIQYVLFAVGTAFILPFIDRFGRRPLLMFGAAAMMGLQFAVGGILAVYSKPIEGLEGDETVTIKIPPENKSAAKGLIACCYLFVVSFSFSWGTVIWGYCSEVNGSNEARAKMVSVSTASNWLFNFALALFVPPSFSNISWKTYFIFGAFCGAMGIHVYLAFPETKGKRLEELGQIWDEKVPAWKSASYVPYVPTVGSDAESEPEKEKAEVDHVENNNEY